MNKNKFIKLPEGLIKKSNEKGLFDILIKWYRLKANTIDGRFRKSSALSQISNILGLEIKTIYTVVSKLLKLKWIRKDKSGDFLLCSYDSLWEFFEYDLTIQHKRIKNKRKGNFKIFKIKSINVKDLMKYGSLCELRNNYRKQKFVINKKIKELKISDIEYIRNLMPNSSLVDFAQHIKDKFNINIFPLISCQGVADLLGFSSKSSGHKIEKMLVESKLISFTKMKDSSLRPLCSLLNFSKFSLSF